MSSGGWRGQPPKGEVDAVKSFQRSVQGKSRQSLGASWEQEVIKELNILLMKKQGVGFKVPTPMQIQKEMGNGLVTARKEPRVAADFCCVIDGRAVMFDAKATRDTKKWSAGDLMNTSGYAQLSQLDILWRWASLGGVAFVYLASGELFERREFVLPITGPTMVGPQDVGLPNNKTLSLQSEELAPYQVSKRETFWDAYLRLVGARQELKDEPQEANP